MDSNPCPGSSFRGWFCCQRRTHQTGCSRRAAECRTNTETSAEHGLPGEKIGQSDTRLDILPVGVVRAPWSVGLHEGLAAKDGLRRIGIVKSLAGRGVVPRLQVVPACQNG